MLTRPKWMDVLMFSHFFDQKRENNRKTVDNWVWGQQGKSMTLLSLFDNFITKPFFLSSESTTRSDGVIFPQLHNILMSFASLVSFGGASTLTIQLVLTKSSWHSVAVLIKTWTIQSDLLGSERTHTNLSQSHRVCVVLLLYLYFSSHGTF